MEQGNTAVIKKTRHRRRRRVNNRHLSDKYYYSGVHETETRISLTQYDESKLSKHEIKLTEPDFSKLTDKNKVNWFEVSGLMDAEVITRLVKECGLHNLDAKDILTSQHVIKIEEYNERLLLILNSCFYNEHNELHTEHISILVADHVVITFTESNNPVFESVMQALKTNLLNIRKKGTGILLVFLLNTIIANLTDSAAKVEELLEEIEDTLLTTGSNDNDIKQDIQQRRHDFILIRKNSQPLKEQFPKLMRSQLGIITDDLLPLYGDLSDQIQFTIQTMEGCRDIVSSLLDLYVSNNDLKMNAIMKRLTVVSTIFIPLTFLVGVWGMNFENMPELYLKYGYLAAWIIMIAAGIFTWLFLKKKDWY